MRAIYDAGMKLAASLFLGAFLGLLCASCDGAETGHHVFPDAGPDGWVFPLIENYGAGCINGEDCATPGSVCLVDGPTGDSYCTLPCDDDPSCPSPGHCVTYAEGSYCVAD